MRPELNRGKTNTHDYGYAQTGGDQFVSVPSAKALWNGDFVFAKEPAVSWLLDGHMVETCTTLQGVYDAFDAEI